MGCVNGNSWRISGFFLVSLDFALEAAMVLAEIAGASAGSGSPFNKYPFIGCGRVRCPGGAGGGTGCERLTAGARFLPWHGFSGGRTSGYLCFCREWLW